MDWFYVENRIRKLNYDILQPVTAKQRKQEKMFAEIIARLDKQQFNQDGFEFELHKATEKLKIVEHFRYELTNMENERKVFSEKITAKQNDQSQRLTTLHEKFRNNENMLRVYQNQQQNLEKVIKEGQKTMLATK